MVRFQIWGYFKKEVVNKIRKNTLIIEQLDHVETKEIDIL